MAALGLAIGLPFSRRSGGGLSLGYLADHVADQVDSRIAPANPATDKAIFSAFDHATPTYTRSATCWAADLDLTALSVWNSAGVATKAGVAISPRHVLFCTHDAPAASFTIRFVAADNTLVTRTITALEGIPVTASNYPDITIGLLDSDLPPSIGFVKILPVGWIPYLPLQSGPVLIVDQERKALVSNLYGIGWFEIRTAICEAPGDATRLSFHENLISGDSGSPALFIIQDQLVLIFSATTGGAGGGTFVTGFISELNAIMTSLGGGYDLTEVSLSAFTQVSPPSPTPTLSITTKANESLTLEWDGVFPANVYVDDSLVLINQISGTAITGLTNFIDAEPLGGSVEKGVKRDQNLVDLEAHLGSRNVLVEVRCDHGDQLVGFEPVEVHQLFRDLARALDRRPCFRHDSEHFDKLQERQFLVCVRYLPCVEQLHDGKNCLAGFLDGAGVSHCGRCAGALFRCSASPLASMISRRSLRCDCRLSPNCEVRTVIACLCASAMACSAMVCASRCSLSCWAAAACRDGSHLVNMKNTIHATKPNAET